MHDSPKFVWALLVGLLAHAVAGVLPAPEPAALDRWGAPEGVVLERPGYWLSFDSSRRVARWTLHRVARDTLAGQAARTNYFQADEGLPASIRATLADFDGQAWDRGHLVPAGDFGAAAPKAATFLLSNIAPQQAGLNRGAWKAIEESLRSEARDGAEVWCVTLPLFLPRADPARPAGQRVVRYGVVGPHDVAVPTHFGKAALILPAGAETPLLRAWIAPNEEPSAHAGPDQFRVATRDLERAAGLDLWPRLAPALAERLERAQPP